MESTHPLNNTVFSAEYVSFVQHNTTYYFTIERRLHEEGRQKHVYLGYFSSNGDSAHRNNTLPDGVAFDTLYCLKQATVTLPLQDTSHPQNRHFWDFFPFEGDNLRQVIALNDDALSMSNMLKNGILDPFADTAPSQFRCAVLEPVYEPFRIRDFPSYYEKIDCMLQIVSGLKQLMSEQTLKKLKIVAHRDLKFNNVVVERLPDGTRRLRLIDFPTVKFSPREKEPVENRTCLGFFSYSNTAPEDVMKKYTVSEKTDVFALGTMLAEIFEVWHYDGICNPLTLLFKLANGVNPEDAAECQAFYSNLEARFPYHSDTHWLEAALHAHDKNAAWDKVSRICSDIRKLFLCATAIDPQNRISLNRFEEELHTIYNMLPVESDAAVRFQNAEAPVMYFLVDTSDLDQYREVYLKAAADILRGCPDTCTAVLHYHCSHASHTLTPDPSPLSPEAMPAAAVTEHLRQLTGVPRGESDLSGLKGCLYDLCGYLGNETNRRRFNGEIHIFAPEAPNEANTCCFRVSENGVGGVPEIVALTAHDIYKKIGADAVTIYVHTFEGAACPDEPYWYIPLYFNTRKPAPIPPASPDAEETPTAKEPVFRKGVGFHFIGGKQIN